MDFSLLGLWSQMGAVAKTVVIILLAMSMYAIGVGLEPFLTCRKSRNRSLEYLRQLTPLLEGRLDQAEGMQTTFADAPLARIISVGLSEFKQGMTVLGAQ